MTSHDVLASVLARPDTLTSPMHLANTGETDSTGTAPDATSPNVTIRASDRVAQLPLNASLLRSNALEAVDGVPDAPFGVPTINPLLPRTFATSARSEGAYPLAAGNALARRILDDGPRKARTPSGNAGPVVATPATAEGLCNLTLVGTAPDVRPLTFVRARSHFASSA